MCTCNKKNLIKSNPEMTEMIKVKLRDMKKISRRDITQIIEVER